MPEITTRAASAETWEDVVAAMTGGGDGGSCWCQWFTMSAPEWRESRAPQRRAALEAEVVEGPPPGLVAYVDGNAAGWVRIGPRVAQGRLGRSWMRRASPTPMTDPSVWAITCLQVRREHRRIGVTSALVAAAVEFAREHDAAAVEAYPIDTAVTAVRTNDLYHGAASTFLAQGFTEVARPKPARPLLVLELR